MSDNPVDGLYSVSWRSDADAQQRETRVELIWILGSAPYYAQH